MHGIAKILILVVQVCSVWNNPITKVEGRNLTFKANLIRRNESSMSLGSISHGHRIRLSSTYFDQKEVNADVTPNGGEYYMMFSIGTPPVEYTAIADTGSDLIWLQCSPCSPCLQQESPLFHPNSSSTYQSIPCNFPCSAYPGLYTACSPTQQLCAYTAVYGSGESYGILSTDTISFPDVADPGFPSAFVLGCGHAQQLDFKGMGSHGFGIVGLGRGPLSLVSQLGPAINYRFSYCLTPSSSNVPGKIQFGGIAHQEPGVVSTPFTTASSNTYYTLTLHGISVGSSSVAASLPIIIDSGTTYTYVPAELYGRVRAAMIGSIRLSPVPDPNKLLYPCYNIQSSGEGFSPPDATFHFEGADVVLKAVNTFRQVDDNLSCLAILPTSTDLPIVIFGNIAQINFEVGYDLTANQVSFAPADCTNY